MKIFSQRPLWIIFCNPLVSFAFLILVKIFYENGEVRRMKIPMLWYCIDDLGDDLSILRKILTIKLNLSVYWTDIELFSIFFYQSFQRFYKIVRRIFKTKINNPFFDFNLFFFWKLIRKDIFEKWSRVYWIKKRGSEFDVNSLLFRLKKRFWVIYVYEIEQTLF